MWASTDDATLDEMIDTERSQISPPTSPLRIRMRPESQSRDGQTRTLDYAAGSQENQSNLDSGDYDTHALEHQEKGKKIVVLPNIILPGGDLDAMNTSHGSDRAWDEAGLSQFRSTQGEFEALAAAFRERLQQPLIPRLSESVLGEKNSLINHIKATLRDNATVRSIEALLEERIALSTSTAVDRASIDEAALKTINALRDAFKEEQERKVRSNRTEAAVGHVMKTSAHLNPAAQGAIELDLRRKLKMVHDDGVDVDRKSAKVVATAIAESKDVGKLTSRMLAVENVTGDGQGWGAVNHVERLHQRTGSFKLEKVREKIQQLTQLERDVAAGASTNIKVAQRMAQVSKTWNGDEISQNFKGILYRRGTEFKEIMWRNVIEALVGITNDVAEVMRNDVFEHEENQRVPTEVTIHRLIVPTKLKAEEFHNKVVIVGTSCFLVLTAHGLIREWGMNCNGGLGGLTPQVYHLITIFVYLLEIGLRLRLFCIFRKFWKAHSPLAFLQGDASVSGKLGKHWKGIMAAETGALNGNSLSAALQMISETSDDAILLQHDLKEEYACRCLYITHPLHTVWHVIGIFVFRSVICEYCDQWWLWHILLYRKIAFLLFATLHFVRLLCYFFVLVVDRQIAPGFISRRAKNLDKSMFLGIPICEHTAMHFFGGTGHSELEVRLHKDRLRHKLDRLEKEKAQLATDLVEIQKLSTVIQQHLDEMCPSSNTEAMGKQRKESLFKRAQEYLLYSATRIFQTKFKR